MPDIVAITESRVQRPPRPAEPFDTPVVPATIRDAFGLFTIDAHGDWAWRMAPDAPLADPGCELTRDYAVLFDDGSRSVLTLPVRAVDCGAERPRSPPPEGALRA